MSAVTSTDQYPPRVAAGYWQRCTERDAATLRVPRDPGLAAEVLADAFGGRCAARAWLDEVAEVLP